MQLFFNSWVIFTLVLFRYGPIPWEHGDSLMVPLIVLSCLAVFNLGAMAGRRLPALPAHDFKILVRSSGRWWIAGLFVLLSAFHTYSVTGRLIFDISAYSVDFNAVYLQYQTVLSDRTTGGIENILLLLKSIIMPVVILLIVTSFRRETPLLLVVLFPFMASGFMRGTDKETVDLLIYMLVLAYYHRMIGRRAVIVVGVLVAVLFLFAMRKLARFEGVTLVCLPSTPEACFSFDNWLSVNLSPSLEFARIILTNYIVQGYEGMAHALQMPFEFSWGFGHMLPVKLKLCQMFNMMCEIQTYGDRLPEYGWDTRFKWTSAYTVIANDFHWTFLPIYTGALGVMFGVSEKSWWETKDRVSLACILLVVLFVIYSSANMQLTVSLEWTAVYLTLFLWQWARIILHSPSLTSHLLDRTALPHPADRQT